MALPMPLTLLLDVTYWIHYNKGPTYIKPAHPFSVTKFASTCAFVSAATYKTLNPKPYIALPVPSSIPVRRTLPIPLFLAMNHPEWLPQPLPLSASGCCSASAPELQAEAPLSACPGFSKFTSKEKWQGHQKGNWQCVQKRKWQGHQKQWQS